MHINKAILKRDDQRNPRKASKAFRKDKTYSFENKQLNITE